MCSVYFKRRRFWIWNISRHNIWFFCRNLKEDRIDEDKNNDCVFVEKMGVVDLMLDTNVDFGVGVILIWIFETNVVFNIWKVLWIWIFETNVDFVFGVVLFIWIFEINADFKDGIALFFEYLILM